MKDFFKFSIYRNYERNFSFSYQTKLRFSTSELISKSLFYWLELIIFVLFKKALLFIILPWGLSTLLLWIFLFYSKTMLWSDNLLISTGLAVTFLIEKIFYLDICLLVFFRVCSVIEFMHVVFSEKSFIVLRSPIFLKATVNS